MNEGVAMMFILVVGVLVVGAAVLLLQQWAHEALVPAADRTGGGAREQLRRRALVAAVRPFGDANWRPARPRPVPRARSRAA
jgi:hypothetical protein